MAGIGLIVKYSRNKFNRRIICSGLDEVIE